MNSLTQKLLMQTGLFDHIGEGTLAILSANFQEIYCATNEIIIHEGDIGDAFYIIAEGAVRVFTEDQEGKEIVLARLEAGNYFGEQALLEDIPKPRNASVRAINEVKLLKISHSLLSEVLYLNQELRHLLAALGKIQLLEKLTKQLSGLSLLRSDLVNLVEGETREYTPDEVIFNAGDVADYVYFIIEGKVNIHIEDRTSLGSPDIILGEGHFFGELGVLENQPRFGTAKSIGDVKVLAIEADRFKEIYEQNSELRKLVSALYNIYQIPNRGIVTQYIGKFLGMEAVNSIFTLEDGSTVLAARVLETNIFSIMKSDITNSRKLRYESGELIWREATIADEKLVGITNMGTWDDLGTVSAMVLNGTVINASREQAFLKTGMFSDVVVTASPQASFEFDTQIICECMLVERRTINQAIQAGVTQVEQIAEKTGAGTVCGTCRQKIADMLGRAIWYPASLQQVKVHNNIIRSYSLTPINSEFKAPLAGQYIIVQAQINRNWIERAYTLTSLPTSKNYEITIKCEPLGLFSQWLFRQKKEIPLVRVSPPMGQFVLDPNMTREAICFAGGIGITPIYTIVRALQENQSQRRVHIEYCALTPDDFIFVEELKTMVALNPNISLVLRSNSEEGVITSEHVSLLLNKFAQPELYICGPKGFEDVIVAAAKSNNIEDTSIHVEQFIHAGGPLRNE